MARGSLGPTIILQRFIKDFAQIMLGTKKGPGTKRTEQNARTTLFSIEREVLVKLIGKHESKIRKKFPGINMNEVYNYVERTFRDSLERNFSQSNVKDRVGWTNSARNVVEGSNFRMISDLATHVRKDVREQAIRIINTSNNKLQRRESLSAGIIIGGLDVRQSRSVGGGDLGREHINVDRANGIFELAEGSGQELARIAKRRKQGFDIGHTFGPGLGNIIHFVGKGEGHETPAITAFLNATERSQLVDIRDKLIGIDASISIDTRLFSSSGAKEGTITITVAEFAPDNQESGARSRQLIADAQKILKRVAKDLGIRVTASPTILDQYKAGIIELFLTGKVKTKRKRKTASTKQRTKVKLKVYGPGFTDYKDGPQGRETQVPETNIQQIIDLVNSRLDTQITKNMGKGRATQILNWRSGTLSKSALLKNLTASTDKNTLVADVKYHGPPYDRFQNPGDPLFKPGRRIDRLFGRSIRQILQEQKIVTLQRVKVRLHND